MRVLCEQWDMNSVETSGCFTYTHKNPGISEYDPLLKVLFGLKDMLSGYDKDLHGYSLILEALDDELHAILPRLLLMIRERRGLYLGHNATKLLSHLFSGKNFKGLWKIDTRKQQDDQRSEAASTLLIQRPFFEDLLDRITPWLNGKRLPGELHISGEEINGLHLLGNCIIQRLTVSEARGKLIYAVLEEQDNLLCAIARSINVRELEWVEQEYSRLEHTIWKEKKAVLWNHYPTTSNSSRVIEKPESNMLIVMELYLRAYARWSYSHGSIPLIIMFLRKKLSDTEQWFLQLLMKDGQRESRLFWFFLAPATILPPKAIILEKIRMTLNDYTALENLAVYKKNNFSEKEREYAEESTERKVLAVYHFLHNKDFFTKMLPSRLRNYGGGSMEASTGVIQRSLNLLSAEARELLYMCMLIGMYLDKDQVFSFFESRGKPRIRIIELYKELQEKGYLFYEQVNNVAFRMEISKLALHFTNTGLIQDSIQFILNPDNGVRLQSGLMEFITDNSKHHTYVPIIYRHLQMLIDCRRYQQAEDDKHLLQSLNNTALALIDARLALEFGEFSEEMIPSQLPQDDFWKGEWLTIQTLFFIIHGRHSDARQSCKSAIILFQNIQDDYGLHQTNNIFGYLHHCAGKHQEAIHYFTITERKRDSAGKQNSIFAEFMRSVSNFIQGRYSRVKKALLGDEGLLVRLQQDGAHSWTWAAAFLMARTYFAMGQFEEAQTLLGNQLNSFREADEQQIHELFYTWIARCLMYQGKYKAATIILKHLPPTFELSLFKAEACILQEQFADALEILRHPENNPAPSPSFNILFSWQTGFSWLEDLLAENLSEDNALVNLRHAIIAYAMGNTGDFEKSIENFYWLTKEKKVSPADPHLSTILFWYSRILEQSRKDEEEDWLTMLGRAVKFLQETSSNIEEPADKRAFLKNVIWNRELFNSAKKYNLL